MHAAVRVEAGQLRKAHALYQEALDVASRHGGRSWGVTGLALAGIAATLSRRRSIAIALVIAAVLTKEHYILVPFSLAFLSWREDRRFALALGLGPVAALAAWSAWVYSSPAVAVKRRGGRGDARFPDRLPMAGSGI